MKKGDLEALLCFKIGRELEQFKEEIAKMELDEILAHAYQVDTMITIYELLLEMSQQIGREILERMVLFPDLLFFLYERWLQTDDSHMQELQDSLNETLGNIRKNPGKCREEVQAA